MMIGYIYVIMPKFESNIYDVYIGSTTKILSVRFDRHRRDYIKWKLNGGFLKEQNYENTVILVNGLEGYKGDYMTSIEIFEKYGIENCKICILQMHEAERYNTELKNFYINKIICVNYQMRDYNVKNRDKKRYYDYKIDNKQKICDECIKYDKRCELITQYKALIRPTDANYNIIKKMYK